MSIEMFITALSALAIHLLFYCLIYTIVIIAVMLTGNIIISCFGTAVFFLYGPMIMMVKDMCFRDFFTTYYADNRLEKNLLFLSPIGTYIDTANQILSDMASDIYIQIIKVLIVTTILLVFSVWLYKKRRSEAAGQAMAFEYSKPVIKFLLVIPLSVGGGIMFRDISNRSSDAWFIFGLIFSLMIVYAIIEIIYNFDIRSAFNHKTHLVACAGIVAVIACILQFDLLRYDTYLPNKNNVKSMSVAMSGIDNVGYFELKSGKPVGIEDAKYQLKYMELTDFDAAYDLAKLGVARAQENKGNTKHMNNYYAYTVKYTLKNGSEIYRTYTLNVDESYDKMKEIYASTEFKQGHFPIYKWDTPEFGDLSCSNMLGRKKFSLTIAEKKELLELYKQELNTLTLDQLVNSTPLATLYIQIGEPISLDCYIYPTFEKTIAFLKNHGFDATKEVAIKDIKKIVIDNNQSLSEAYDSDDEQSYKTTRAVARKRSSKTYSNESQIREIFPHLIENKYYNSNNTILNVDTDIRVDVFIGTDDYGNEQSYHFVFKPASVPDFVKQDIHYIEK
jgi:ABC-2 type transport system permease protein